MIDHDFLEGKFARIGARIKLAGGRVGRRNVPPETSVLLDIRRDRVGEYFEVIARRDAESRVEVLDVQPVDRHILLLVREGVEKHKFLCGHDERHWFVAAVPEAAPVGTVRAAKEALKPAEVQSAQAQVGLRSAARNRRKNAAYHRQGEWFFLPAPGVVVHENFVLRDEPLSRGIGSKPHIVDYCYRLGGETVYVCSLHPGGLVESLYRRLLKKHPEAKNWGWNMMQRNAEVYVRGRVRHADHRTITLHGWHRVLMNTEHQSQAMRHVAFLD